MQGNRITEIF